VAGRAGRTLPHLHSAVEALALNVDGGRPDLSKLGAGLLNDPIEPLTRAVAACTTTPSRVLWGNVASAVNSAANLIARHRPSRGPEALAFAQLILSDGRLRTEPAVPGPRFRRRSCCLIYRVSGDRTAVCGDCVLLRGEEQVAEVGLGRPPDLL